ncbi:MAG: hypothetical protein L0241_28015 [Planctomycetia bacterium]|nr:hypothetical protein [Planctomycetia bacterium]
MRRLLFLVPIAVVAFPTLPAQAGDRPPLLQRIAERAPLPKFYHDHSIERAGYPQSNSAHGLPSVGPYDAGGYVGGRQLCCSALFNRGPYSGAGPIYDGTFATDFGGFRHRLGRVFLAPSPNPAYGPVVSNNYRTDTIRLTDIGTLRPLRKAVLEAKEAREEHGEGGHGGGHGHGFHHGGGHGGHGGGGH